MKNAMACLSLFVHFFVVSSLPVCPQPVAIIYKKMMQARFGILARRFWLMVALLMASSLTVLSQSPDSAGRRNKLPKEEKVFYKGQVHVSRVLIYHDDAKVHIHMRITFSTDLLNRGEKLHVSPQLRKDENRNTFAPMVFDGKSKKWRVRNSDVIVGADEAYGQDHFDIEYIGNYHEWMQGADLCFLSEEIVAGGVRNHFTDFPFTNIHIPRQVEGETVSPLVADTPGVATQPAPVARQTAPTRQPDPYNPSHRKPHDNQRILDTRWHLRANLLHAAALMPNLGVEYGLKPNLSLAVNAGGNWIKWDLSHYWRLMTVDAELRYWLGNRGGDARLVHKGHHVGVYVGWYRYTFEFGGVGQFADYNFGGGVSYGYSVPIGRRLSLDLSLGLGFVGGKYIRYEPREDRCYYWLSDENRALLGPTKAEISLIWHVGH